MHKLLIAALLTMFSTGAMAEWTYLGSPTDNTYDVYIDKTTIRKRGNVAKIWDMQDYKSPRKAGGKSYSSIKVFSEYDCVEIRRRTLGVNSCSENMGKGKVVLNHQSDDNEQWVEIVPDSVAMAEWEVACKK